MLLVVHQSNRFGDLAHVLPSLSAVVRRFRLLDTNSLDEILIVQLRPFPEAYAL
jgi:hypothetical protein